MVLDLVEVEKSFDGKGQNLSSKIDESDFEKIKCIFPRPMKF